MMVSLDWNMVFSFIGALIAISGWVWTWKRAAMREGERKKEVEQMQKDLIELQKKEEYLRGCTEENTGAVREVVRDIDWIRKALERIELLLQKKEP